MGENAYLLLMAKGSLQPLAEKFNELEGFYTGIGYAFPSKNESFLRQIVNILPEAKIVTIPLTTSQNFQALKQSYKAAYFKERLIEIEKEVSSIHEIEQLEGLSESTIKASCLSEERKNYLLEIVYEKERLKKAFDWAEGMEKALNQSQTINIEFVNEKAVNFLLDEAPEFPLLVNYIDGDRPKPFIRKGIVGMLVGAGGVGKTHALAQLAISLVTGIPWLGKYPIENPGHVFLGLGENSEEDIHRLLRKIVKIHIRKENSHTFFDKNPFHEAAKRLAIHSFTGLDATFIYQNTPTSFFDSFLNALKMKEPEDGWSCIILDPISRFLGADAETDNAIATRFISLLERITMELKGNPTFLFGHHMNKSGIGSRNTDQAAARGSSAITDGVRWQANLERVQMEEPNEISLTDNNTVILRCVKSNFTALLPPQKLYKDEAGNLHAADNAILASSKTIKGKNFHAR